MNTELKTKEAPAETAVAENPGTSPLRELRLRPVADVYRSEDAVRILLDVPGASENDLEVNVHDGVLSLRAQVERSRGELRVYERAFRVDRRMDTAAIEAQLQRGVLELRIPFLAEARPRRIEVKRA